MGACLPLEPGHEQDIYMPLASLEREIMPSLKQRSEYLAQYGMTILLKYTG
jgi:hypothetical protein